MVSIIEIIITILLINTSLLILGSVIFGFACIRDRELFSYLPIQILFLIGNLFILHQFVSNIYRIVATFFFAATSFSLFIAAALDYYKIFFKSRLEVSHISHSLLAVVVISPIVVSLQIFMIFILIIASIMLFRVYLRTRSTVKLLFMSCGLVSMISIGSQLIPYYDFEFGLFLAYLTGTVFITILLIIGLVAILEQENNKNLNVKNNLKDSYSHELGNILHSISISYELINIAEISEQELHKLHKLLKEKIREASELVKEIRNL